ncbi:hypothetical protein J4558_26760 [Leptolyngbya sp. 15MV]|nr:hypothetical protein J4558_26760 [Leptolyngbya sp. 15MV]
MIARRSLVAGALALPAVARAQAWPSRPVRIVVPFGLGGSADVAARFLSEPLQAAFGQPFVVENRPGAGAVIGTDLVAKSPPDGQTLLLMSSSLAADAFAVDERSVARSKIADEEASAVDADLAMFTRDLRARDADLAFGLSTDDHAGALHGHGGGLPGVAHENEGHIHGWAIPCCRGVVAHFYTTREPPGSHHQTRYEQKSERKHTTCGAGPHRSTWPIAPFRSGCVWSRS